MKFSQYLFNFLMGYFVYGFIEIMCRSYTHWTMCLTGGLVMTILYVINSNKAMTLIKSCAIGAAIITGIEFLVGVFDNIIMDWHVWDYSDRPFNVLGQICPLYSTLWFLLCIPAFFLSRIIYKRFNQ